MPLWGVQGSAQGLQQLFEGSERDGGGIFVSPDSILHHLSSTSDPPSEFRVLDQVEP